MKRLIIIFLALIIPILIWYVEKLIARKRGIEIKGPSLKVLLGFVISIMIIVLALFINQSTFGPEGAKYSPARSINGKIVPGVFE